MCVRVCAPSKVVLLAFQLETLLESVFHANVCKWDDWVATAQLQQADSLSLSWQMCKNEAFNVHVKKEADKTSAICVYGHCTHSSPTWQQVWMSCHWRQWYFWSHYQLCGLLSFEQNNNRIRLRVRESLVVNVTVLVKWKMTCKPRECSGVTWSMQNAGCTCTGLFGGEGGVGRDPTCIISAKKWLNGQTGRTQCSRFVLC